MRVLLIRSLYIQAVVLVVASIPNYRPNMYIRTESLTLRWRGKVSPPPIYYINKFNLIYRLVNTCVHIHFFQRSKNGGKWIFSWKKKKKKKEEALRSNTLLVELLFTNFYLLSIVGNKGSRAAEDI